MRSDSESSGATELKVFGPDETDAALHHHVASGSFDRLIDFDYLDWPVMAAGFEQSDTMLDIVAHVGVLKMKPFDHYSYLQLLCRN